MTTLVHVSTKFSHLRPECFRGGIYKRPTFSLSQLDTKFVSFHQGSFKLRACRERWSFLGGTELFKNGVLLEGKGCKREKRVVLVKNNQGFGFNGGGGGGGRDDGANVRILGNLALAIGLTYLSMTGQLGWILDAIVSIWVLFSLLVWFNWVIFSLIIL